MKVAEAEELTCPTLDGHGSLCSPVTETSLLDELVVSGHPVSELDRVTVLHVLKKTDIMFIWESYLILKMEVSLQINTVIPSFK